MRHGHTMSDTLAYLFSVNGRINRLDYLHCLFLGLLLALMAGLLAAFLGLIVASIADVPPGKVWWADPLAYGALPAILIGGAVWLTAMIRRWHDIGAPAWISVPLFALMPVTDWDLLILALPALIPGNVSGNAFGPVPQSGGSTRPGRATPNAAQAG